MSRYIKKEDAIREICEECRPEEAFKMDREQFCNDHCWVTDIIRGISSADVVERKRGEWNFVGDNMFECTSCKRTYTTGHLNAWRNYNTDPCFPPYCPNCGADMRGDDNER